MTAATGKWARRQAWLVRYGRKIAVGLLGGAVLVGGIAMLGLPGPGIPVALLGLSILAMEFPWARRAQQRVRMRAKAATARARAARQRRRAGPRVDRPLLDVGHRAGGTDSARR